MVSVSSLMRRGGQIFAADPDVSVCVELVLLPAPLASHPKPTEKGAIHLLSSGVPQGTVLGLFLFPKKSSKTDFP